MPAPTRTLEQQLQDLQSSFNRNWGSSISANDRDRYNDSQNQFIEQQNALLGQIVNRNLNSGSDQAQKNRDELFGLARGDLNNKNPIDQMVLQALQDRSGPDAGPFDATTKGALMTQASDAASQAMLNAKGHIQGSAGDQSVIAANNEADARRSQAIQQAQLGINTQANVANYDARGQALGQLGGYNQQVIHNQMDNSRNLQNLLRADITRTQLPDNAGGVPSFTQFSQPQTPQYTQQYQQPNQQPQQRQTSTPQQPQQQPTRTVAPTTPLSAYNPSTWIGMPPANYNRGTYTNLSNPSTPPANTSSGWFY